MHVHGLWELEWNFKISEMRNYSIYKYQCKLALIICLVATLSCNKKKFLDERPSSDIFIPQTLTDFRALLDNDEIMSETPVMGEVSADNYYLSNSFYTALKSREHNCYTWNTDIYFDNERSVGDWDRPYQQVFYANVVLEGLRNISGNKGGNASEFAALKGASHFIRAYAFHNVAQVFSPAYDLNITDDENKYGIPIRKTPLIGDVGRKTVLETYSEIIKDLDTAIQLLPEIIDIDHLNRPTKSAAYALIARVYLSMRKYDSALLYANRCLNIHSALIDYNTISTGSNTPFQRENAEVLYQSKILSTNNVLKAVIVPGCYVDSNLFKSYSIDDLRRSIYYTALTPLHNLKRGYTGTIFLFSGLATDEVYLVKAECLARTGNYTEGMNVLNQLLVKRYTTGTFVPLDAQNAQEALDTILVERNKELSFRGVRWSDLKRLNKEGRNIILSRTADGTNYSLSPNSNKYVHSLPADVVDLGLVAQYTRD